MTDGMSVHTIERHAFSFARQCYYLQNPLDAKGWFVLHPDSIPSGDFPVSPGVYKTAEHDLLDPAVAVDDKIDILQRDLGPLAAKFGKMPINNLFRFVDKAVKEVPDSTLFTDTSIDFVLPPRSVLRVAMHSPRRRNNLGGPSLRDWISNMQAKYTDTERLHIELLSVRPQMPSTR